MRDLIFIVYGALTQLGSRFFGLVTSDVMDGGMVVGFVCHVIVTDSPETVSTYVFQPVQFSHHHQQAEQIASSVAQAFHSGLSGGKLPDHSTMFRHVRTASITSDVFVTMRSTDILT